MHINIYVSLYAYAAANGCAIKFVIDLRGRAWREGKEEGERFISEILIKSATCKVRVTKIKGKTKEKGTAYVHVSFLHPQISTHTGTEERDCFCGYVQAFPALLWMVFQRSPPLSGGKQRSGRLEGKSGPKLEPRQANAGSSQGKVRPGPKRGGVNCESRD